MIAFVQREVNLELADNHSANVVTDVHVESERETLHSCPCIPVDF